MKTFIVSETGREFCTNYEREHYSDINDNLCLVSKQVDHVNYERNLTNQELADKVKKYLKKC